MLNVFTKQIFRKLRTVLTVIIVMIKIQTATFSVYCVPGTELSTVHGFSLNPDHSCEKGRFRPGH